VPPLLAAVLLWSGAVKVVGPGGRVAGTALHRLLAGGRLAIAVYRAVGAIELVVAAVLLLVPGRAGPVAAALLAAGFLGYLGYAAAAAPASSCGCLGGHAPISWRGFARAGLILVVALFGAVGGAAVAGTHAWWSVTGWSGLWPVTGAVFLGGIVVVGGLALVVVFSPELDRYWLLPLRRLRIRLTRPLGGSAAATGVALHATVTQLQRSEAYRRVAPLLTSDILDHWDADQWRIVTYAARHQGRSVTAVFAVPLDSDDTEVRVSIVDETASGESTVDESTVDESTVDASTMDGPALPAAR
jgi:hypothetical protein